MAKTRQVWVSPKSNKGWKVKRTTSSKAVRVTRTKAAAVKLAKKIAKQNKVELVIQNRNGRISEKNSYGRDGYPPKG